MGLCELNGQAKAQLTHIKASVITKKEKKNLFTSKLHGN